MPDLPHRRGDLVRALVTCMVVVPTYQEAAGIRGFLEDLLDHTVPSLVDGLLVEVLVVDDASPDGTGDLVAAHPEFGRRVRLLRRAGKDGLGNAYRAGIREALRAGADVVVQMDADGSHRPADLPALLRAVRGNDLVIGSRYVAGGSTLHWPRRRRALSRAANTYARRMLGLRTHDATAGFRAWRAEAVLRAGVLSTTTDGYGFQVENTWNAERGGLRVAEVPICFVERVQGASKMSTSTALEALAAVARWRLTPSPVAAPTPSPVRTGR